MIDTAEQFIDRINRQNLDPAQLQVIYDMINETKNILSHAQLNQIYTHILKTPGLLESVTELAPGTSIRFVKNTDAVNPLPRTCVIFKYPDGHIELIVMPNRKLSTGEKQKNPCTEGGSKICKISYRIDDPSVITIGRARLRVLLHQNSLRRLKNEALISQQLSTSQFICPMFLSSMYKHTKTKSPAVYAFSELGQCDLYDVIENWLLNNVYRDGQPITELHIGIVSDLLTGLVEIHAHKTVHRDISLGNIIVSNDRIKFIDFDAALSQYVTVDSLTDNLTILTTAPELIIHRNILNRSCYAAKIAQEHLKKFTNETISGADYTDDVWSIGMIIISLLTVDTAPSDYNYINLIVTENPLLQAMLKPTRAERVTAKQALEIWKNNPTLISISHADFNTQNNINNILKIVESELRFDWTRVIERLIQCANLTSNIEFPNSLRNFGYRSSDAYFKAADTLQTIYTQQMMSINTILEQTLTNLDAQALYFSRNKEIKAVLVKCLRPILKSNIIELYPCNESTVAADISLAISKILNKNHKHITCFGREPRYTVKEITLRVAIEHVLAKFKPDTVHAVTLQKLFADEDQTSAIHTKLSIA